MGRLGVVESLAGRVEELFTEELAVDPGSHIGARVGDLGASRCSVAYPFGVDDTRSRQGVEGGRLSRAWTPLERRFESTLPPKALSWFGSRSLHLIQGL